MGFGLIQKAQGGHRVSGAIQEGHIGAGNHAGRYVALDGVSGAVMGNSCVRDVWGGVGERSGRVAGHLKVVIHVTG